MRLSDLLRASLIGAALALAACSSVTAHPGHGGTKAAAPGAESGLVRVRSAYPVEEAIARIKADIAAKGIMFFADIDQAALAEGAGFTLPKQHLLLFGNPPLGIQFLAANPYSGIDWPVRMLVLEDANGEVWIAYTDFTWIARRHGIADRDAQFAKASEVAASIAASAAAPYAGTRSR